MNKRGRYTGNVNDSDVNKRSCAPQLFIQQQVQKQHCKRIPRKRADIAPSSGVIEYCSLFERLCICFKQENILLSQRGPGNIKVVDFGSSCYEQQRGKKRENVFFQRTFQRNVQVWKVWRCHMLPLFPFCQCTPTSRVASTGLRR